MTQAMAARSENDVEWNDEQRKIIRDQFANGANDSEFAALMETARVRGLDPFKKQIYFVKRYDSQKRCEVWATQVSIDGLRAIAERSGRYDGSDEPEWFYDDKSKITKCRVAVHRKDHSRPAVGIAFFGEYVQTTKDGAPTRFWKQMPHVMIAKCAEAQGIRKGFPETAGLYIPEEMGQAENGRVGYDGEVVEHRPAAAVRSIDGGRSVPALAAAGARPGNTIETEVGLVAADMEAAADMVALGAAAAKVNALKSSGLTEAQRADLMRLYSNRKAEITAPKVAPVEPSDPDGTELGHETDAPHLREPGEEG